VSIVLDSVSLLRATRQLRREALRYRRDFLDQVTLTSDPTVRAVFAEDAAAIIGDVIALVGVALHQLTGSPAPEAVSAIIIGLLLIAVGVQLARRNHDFLLGEQAPPLVKDGVRDFVLSYPGVVSVSELLVTFVGPRQVWVLARVDVEDGLRGDEVESLVRGIASGLQEQSDFVARVDVVPAGPSSVAL
jgi:divalent metal cation (Fe/Co/Zn/Cd) transporter